MNPLFRILIPLILTCGAAVWLAADQSTSSTVVDKTAVASSRAGSPSPEASNHVEGLLETNTVLAVYGRSFGIAPILGRLGQYSGFEDMAKDVTERVAKIDAVNGTRNVLVAVHLIYAMATPCKGHKDECLYYLDAASTNLVRDYIEPAAGRGWLVILDTQLGRSTPVTQVKRMIEKGYLKYDNVHVAIDPEFHAKAGQVRPGVPIGTVQADEINEVQQLLDGYVLSERLRKRKIVVVHQFGDPAVADGVPYMVVNKQHLRLLPNVDLVINMDGLGSPAVKVRKYNAITDANRYPFIRYRGIKVFYPNKWEKHGHFDSPPMTLDQIMGVSPSSPSFRIEHSPDVIIIA